MNINNKNRNNEYKQPKMYMNLILYIFNNY